MNGPMLFSIAAILLIVFMMTTKPVGKKRPVFGKVVDADDHKEYTFYEF